MGRARSESNVRALYGLDNLEVFELKESMYMHTR